MFVFTTIDEKLTLIPDCNNVIYNPTISALPFRPCDYRNRGISPLCNLEDEKVFVFLSFNW
jgi:hypothetical protein